MEYPGAAAQRLAPAALLASSAVNPTEAIADLTEISSQVEAAVLVGSDGAVLASTFPAEGADGLARAALALVDRAELVRPNGNAVVTQVRVSTAAGSVFVVREGEHLLAATTQPSPTVGLVLYDLRTCLRGLGEVGEGSAAG